MIHKRVLKIIDVLLKHDKYITIDDVSSNLQVSNKTIRNDLQIVEEWLCEHNLKLIKKTGVGIMIEGSRDDKLRVMDRIKEKSKELLDYSPQARKIFIVMQLLTFDNCRIYELSKQLYVSRATIHKDILAVSDQLATYKINMHRKNNNGISIEGNERSFRNLMLELMLHDNGYQKFLDIVKNPQYICDGSFVFPGLEVSDDEVKDFVSCVLSANNTYISTLTLQSLILVLLRMFITFLRMQDHHYVVLSDHFIVELEKEAYFDDVNNLCNRLANHYRMIIPNMDKRYIQVYFLSSQNSVNLPAKDKEEALFIANSIIACWQEHLKLPFQKDTVLKTSLYAHMCPAIVRFRHGILNNNPLLTDIMSIYKYTFDIAKESVQCIEKHFSCHVSDDEIGYLALHLAASLERMKQPIQTILITHGGPSAAKLLEDKLTQLFEIKIISVQTFFSVQIEDIQNAELIISTSPLRISTKLPTLQINSILQDYDISRLHDAIKDYYKIKNNPLNFRKDVA